MKQLHSSVINFSNQQSCVLPADCTRVKGRPSVFHSSMCHDHSWDAGVMSHVKAGAAAARPASSSISATQILQTIPGQVSCLLCTLCMLAMLCTLSFGQM